MPLQPSWRRSREGFTAALHRPKAIDDDVRENVVEAIDRGGSYGGSERLLLARGRP
jgi:hypothetical protein